MTKTISCKLQFINSAKFIGTLSSKLVDNLAEGIYKVKFKNWHDNK